MTLNRFFARLSNFLAWPLSALRHDTEQRFRATFEQAAVGLSRVAPDGRLLQVNQKLCEITGYSQAELLTRTFQSITHPDDLLADVALSQQLLSGQIETYTLQKRYIRKDTGKLWIRLTVSLVRRPDGSPDYFISVVEDIDQSMQIRAQLRISDLALKAISQGVLITGPDQRIQSVNAAFTSITGYAESDIVGLRCRFLQGPLTDPVQIAQIKHCLDQGMAFSGDILNYRQDGSPFWNELTITALRDEQGELSHFIGITRDISERKHAQAELGRYQHHLEHLVQQRTAELTQARDDADAANLAKRDFLANVSHELRTPLNAVLGLTGLLVDSPLGRRQRDYAFKIESSAQALRTLIDDILDFSRIESGELQLEHAPFSLHAILRNTAAVLGVNLHQKPVEALFDVAADVPDLFIGDTLHLQQIVLNLTNNAAKFTAQGEIVVRVRCSAQSKGIARLQLAVHDTGMGIAADKLGLIFNRFTQGTPSDKRLYGGTGLGLAISARLADLMQAELRVQSVLGEGSVFTLDLPLAVAESQPLAPLALHLQALKILIVDDNASSRAVLARHRGGLGCGGTERLATKLGPAPGI
jgi:PAS domain S-box-containing protein